MIGHTHRFHGYNSLRGVYQRGKTARSTALNLRYGSRGSNKPYRVAVVVSRKVSKSAVTRNRIRRRIYAAVREYANEHDDAINPGTDLVFTVFSDRLAEVSSPELRKTVAELLKNAHQTATERR